MNHKPDDAISTGESVASTFSHRCQGTVQTMGGTKDAPGSVAAI